MHETLHIISITITLFIFFDFKDGNMNTQDIFTYYQMLNVYNSKKVKTSTCQLLIFKSTPMLSVNHLV